MYFWKDSFLFGKFGNKFHNLKLQKTVDGISKIEPGFKQNPRKNFFWMESLENSYYKIY